MIKIDKYKKKKIFYLKIQGQINFTANYLLVFPSNRKCRILIYDKYKILQGFIVP